MTYRVAVIQNESELLRYSYADTRHLLTKAEYDWSYYTSEDINLLERTLPFYDALIISTNACNNPRIATWLSDHQADIASFLEEKERGLLVLFQMALSDERGRAHPFPFLPANLSVRGQQRFGGGEQADQGTLSIGSGQTAHPILRFPHRIDLSVVKDRCIRNNNAPGLYWGYLHDFSADSYDILIEDSSTNPRRALLAVTRLAGESRVALSSLVLDWQRHDELWENVVRYVVEGPEQVAIVRKRGTSSFDMDLLEHVLRERKIPHSPFSVNRLRDWKDDDRIFPSVVLDPGWDRPDIVDFSRSVHSLYEQEGIPSIHFFDQVAPELRAASVIPRQSDYQTVVDTSVAWLVSKWNDDLWDASFWSSYDVIDLFVNVGQATSPYKAKILSEVKARLQPNGSYDDVFGATCAVLQMYKWLDHRGDDFEKALDWVKSKIDSQNLYNMATAVEILRKVAPDALDDAVVRQVVDRITLSAGTWTDGLETLRYMRTLVAVGEHRTAEAQVMRLLPAAGGRTEWLNVFGAAETVLILLDIYESAQTPGADIEKMLFKGVEYLLGQHDYATGTWRSDTVATAKAAKAIYLFSSRASPAMTEAIQSIISKRAQISASRASLDLRRRNRSLTEELAETKRARAALEQQSVLKEAHVRRIENWLVGAFLTTYALVIGLISVILIAVHRLHAIISWASNWQTASIPLAIALIAAPLLSASIMLDQFKRETRWLKFARSNLRFLSGIVGESAKGEEK